MNKLGILFVLALVAVVVLVPDLALAQNAEGAGKATREAISEALKGNLGIMVGLGIAVYGLWQWIMSQNQWGLVIMLGGVALTAFPGIFDGVRDGFQGVFGNSGATKSSVTADN